MTYGESNMRAMTSRGHDRSNSSPQYA